MMFSKIKSFTSYSITIALATVSLALWQINVNAQTGVNIDGDYIENSVEDAADREDADILEGSEDVSVTETEEDVDGDTNITEEVNENYADEVDKDILEDSVDTTDALEQKQ